ncbi:hypothetical protein L1987_08520 [Smallanthus sonchifolius]|uniref:Uncharacterized protein n=1 Tax=Smallanthus sonchifolius TaxID=185202 RepID=A0ACB9JKX3_9ASTR|nr:hypothetical protein L1987_08520 [Smallanthus sonchifolius]
MLLWFRSDLRSTDSLTELEVGITNENESNSQHREIERDRRTTMPFRFSLGAKSRVCFMVWGSRFRKGKDRDEIWI